MEPSKGQLKRVEGYLHTQIHCSIFHNSQKVESHPNVYQQMHGYQNVVYTYNRVLLIL